MTRKIIQKSNFSVHKQTFIGTQPQLIYLHIAYGYNGKIK